MNHSIYTALTSIFLAQFLKIPLKKQKTGVFDWKVFFESGGMPSSHAAGVSALATFIALKKGVRTIDFALSIIFGLIVMYDAQGVRRQTGELTILVNQIDEEVERLYEKVDHHYHDKKDDKLREKLGHQPIEVVGGGIFGIFTGIIGYLLFKKKC